MAESNAGTHHPERGLLRWGALVAAVLLVACSCAARNKVEGAAQEETPGGTAAPEVSQPSAGEAFGEMESPCGEGDLTVDPSEAAGSSDVLRIGVPNDRTSQVRNGLNKEMWDASVAFSEWCNAQGGIGGLQIELVDLDGKLTDVGNAMTTACSSTFMMVGGGWVQDDLQFTGKDGSDFHLCGLAEIPAFTTSPQKSESNGQIQPVPHPASEATAVWMRMFADLYPEQAESMAEVWGDLPAMETIRNQDIAVIEGEGSEVAGVFDYPVFGMTDWTPLAQQVIGSGAGSMHYVGEPTNMGTLIKTLREQGWEGIPMLETNMYDPTYVDSAQNASDGTPNAAGSVIRTFFHPFEEAADWPAVQQYQELVDQYVPDGKIALLGMQSFSAWLLFATAANACGDANDGVLTRACVLEAADEVDDWTAGGLHSPTDPGPEGGPSPTCDMLLEVTDEGTFERLYPELGSEEDSLDGFVCAEDAVAEVPANEGKGVLGEDQPI